MTRNPPASLGKKARLSIMNIRSGPQNISVLVRIMTASCLAPITAVHREHLEFVCYRERHNDDVFAVIS